MHLLWRQNRNFSGVIPYALVVAIFLASSVLIPGYMSWGSVLSLLLLSSLLSIAAVGQTLTILLGGLDLSIPAVMGFADVLLSQLYGRGWPFAAIAGLILTVAVIVGLINGLAARLLDVHPLIVTLASGSIVLGAILASTHGENTGTVPDWLTTAVSVVGHTGVIPLPGAVVLWLGLGLLIVFFERRTLLGRWTFGVGANPRAATLAQIPSLFVWATIYATSAFFAAVAGMLLAGFSGAADAAVGEPYLFTSVAAVVVGGTSLLGGRGGYARTVAGALIITELTTLLVGVGFDEPTQQLVLGILIVLVVAFYGREAHVRMRV